MSLRAKFLNVMKSCAYVQRQGENTFHRYKYATAADVFDKVNTALVQEGIISVARPVILATEQVTNAKGNSETRVTVEMTVTLFDAATGESMALIGYGSGQDTGDKAVMKAQTAALKYTWMLSLNISTGDDPEADASVDARASETAKPPAETVAAKVQPTSAVNTPGDAPALAPTQPQANKEPNRQLITPEQLRIIFVLGRRAGLVDEVMKDRIHRTYGVASSRELTKQQASALIDELKREVHAAEQAAG